MNKSIVLPQNTPFTDSFILRMLVQKNPLAWEHLYDKYAPMMYGTILNMTGDESTAEEIFQAVFRELKEKKMLSRLSTALCHRLLRHTYRLTMEHLKARGLAPLNTKPLSKDYPLVNLLCFEALTLKEAAMKSGLSEHEMPNKLRTEFNQLRNHSEQSHGISEKLDNLLKEAIEVDNADMLI